MPISYPWSVNKLYIFYEQIMNFSTQINQVLKPGSPIPPSGRRQDTGIPEEEAADAGIPGAEKKAPDGKTAGVLSDPFSASSKNIFSGSEAVPASGEREKAAPCGTAFQSLFGWFLFSENAGITRPGPVRST